MYILVGHRNRIVEDQWAGRYNCGSCGQPRDFYLKKVKTDATVFFLPIMTFTTKRCLVCDGCDCYKVLKGKEYKELLRAQNEKMEKGEFPREVILKSFGEKRLKLNSKRSLMIGGIALGAILTLGIVTIPISFFLIYFGIKNYVVAKKKHKLYLEAIGK